MSVTHVGLDQIRDSCRQGPVRRPGPSPSCPTWGTDASTPGRGRFAARGLDDDEAYMQLVLCNTQSELHPLEEGKHAAESGLDLKAYAKEAGKALSTMHDKVKAFRVMSDTNVRIDDISDGWVRLSIVHAAPQWLWSALVTQMLADGWTVAQTRAKVAELKETADPAGWPKVPCWVRELDDDEAYMQLVLCNTQSELHPLEEGIHAMRSGKEFASYGREVNKSKDYLRLRVNAAEVLEHATHVAFSDVRDNKWRNLAEIHAAPQWLWSALVTQMLADGWTVAQTRAKVAELKETADPAGWMDAGALASALVTGTLRQTEIQRMERAYAEHKVRDEDLREALFNALAQAPGRGRFAARGLCSDPNLSPQLGSMGSNRPLFATQAES